MAETNINIDINIVPTLKQIGCVKIVVSLFQQDEVLELIRAFLKKSKFIPTDTKKMCFKHLFNNVAKTFDRYIVDSFIKIQVLSFGVIMHTELLTWLCYQGKFTSPRLSINFTNHLHLVQWTPLGRIDYRDTGVKMINNLNLDHLTNYLLACINFLPEEVIRYAPRVFSLTLIYKCFSPKLANYIYFWHHRLEGINEDISRTVRKYLMENNLESISSKDYYNATILDEAYYEYRWKRWAQKERDATLLTLAGEDSPNLIYYVFKSNSVVREFVLHTISKEYMKTITNNIIYIEHYDILLARRCHSLLPADYWFLFKKLNEELLSAFEGQYPWDLYRCGMYLMKTWNYSTDVQRRYVIDQYQKGFSGLMYMLQSHTNFLSYVAYKFSTKEQLRKILFSTYGMGICLRLIENNSLALLIVIVAKCGLRLDELHDFEEKFLILCGISLKYMMSCGLRELTDFSI